MKRKHLAGSLFAAGAMVIVILIARCSKPANVNKFADPELVKLAEFCDRRATDSLLSYLTHRQPLLRVEAAFALASVRDPKAVDALHKTLVDPVAEVRSASAYALGQTLHPSSIKPLSIQLLHESNAATIIAIGEAIGKIAGALQASNSAGEWVEDAANAIFNFERTDSIGVHTLAKAAFWMHNGGWSDSRFMNRMASTYAAQSPVNRRMIAYAMGRYRGEWYRDTLQANVFLDKLRLESDTVAKTAGIAVAGRTESFKSAHFISDILTSDGSTTEQLIAACRAASKNSLVQAAPILSLIRHRNESVADEACAALIGKKLNPSEKTDLRSIQHEFSLPIQIAITRILYTLGDTLFSGDQLNARMNGRNVYEKATCIRALGLWGQHAKECLNSALREENIIIAGAYTEAFIESHSKPNYPVDLIYSDGLISLLTRGDVGITALIAAEIRNQSWSDSEKQSLNDALKQGLQKLVMPKEVETANEIIRALNQLGISPMEEIKAEYNHPIDWEFVKTIPRKQRATIVTNKGDIEIELHVDDAPGSVASFIKLCRDGFYKDRFFHRVVPNFVIQGGCPRGDGMGGTDYTLRSEFRLHDYRTGSVGLASSGPDTESCQFFITHLPTPHLEGRYTIFAHVKNGMDVVDQIIQGATIERIELIED